MLDNKTIDKIKADAENYAGVMVWVNQNPKGEEQLFYEYISTTSHEAGATEWAGKAEGLADAIRKLNSAIDKLWNECNTKAIPDKYKKEIASAQAQCGAALAKYKEVSNG